MSSLAALADVPQVARSTAPLTDNAAYPAIDCLGRPNVLASVLPDQIVKPPGQYLAQLRAVHFTSPYNKSIVLVIAPCRSRTGDPFGAGCY